MACYDTSPYTCTYDSGGVGSLPGGGDPDYTSLATWEADSDNSLSGYTGPVILDCYDSQVHPCSITCTVAGASSLSSTVFRAIRSADGCAVPWAGKVGSGANFSFSTSGFSVGEGYFRLIDLYVAASANSSTNLYCVSVNSSETVKFVNCVFHSVNTGGYGYGYYGNLTATGLCFGCIAYECTSNGFRGGAWNGRLSFVCCTSCNNGGWGFLATDSSAGTASVWSCYASGNSSGDFYPSSSLDTYSGWNASADATANMGGYVGDNYKHSLSLDLDADYLPTTGTFLSGSGGAGDNYGRNPFDDYSSYYDSNDFLKNDTDGDPLSKLDIRGNSRPNADTADSAWAVGAAEYAETSEAIQYLPPSIVFIGL